MVLRALRPYTVRHAELDEALLETLLELNHRQHQLETTLAELEKRRRDDSD
jgi:hypothetical protein